MKAKENLETKVIEVGKKKTDGLVKCPKCSSTDITYSEKKKKLICNYCRCEFDEEKHVDNEDIKKLKGKTIGSGAKKISEDASDLITIECEGCGAEIVIDTNDNVQKRCHWCRSYLSLNKKVPNGAVPDLVLPFLIAKDDARKSIEGFVKKRQFFAHPIFKKEFTTENILGVYLPYMVIDLNTHSKFTGEAEILVREYTVGDDEDERTYYDADAYDIEREFDLAIDNLTVESSVDKLDHKDKVKTTNIINSIMPFDLENAVVWDANFLKGYTSEKRDTNIDELSDYVYVQAKDIARHAINDDLVNYDRGVSWDSEELSVVGEKWLSAYLPVWLYSYKSGDNTLHYVAVNARSKETMGSVPINKPKLIFVSFIVEIFCLFATAFADFDGFEYAFLIGGFLYYYLIYSSYRNQGARHKYEKETKNEISNLVRVDDYTGLKKGLSNSRISGQNNKRVNTKTFEEINKGKIK